MKKNQIEHPALKILYTYVIQDCYAQLEKNSQDIELHNEQVERLKKNLIHIEAERSRLQKRIAELEEIFEIKPKVESEAKPAQLI
ncbi:hypothetical protein NIES22_73890 (plasmid) [Calothrix brevissima NIES-22]|nr:hypothetical protein NIES22_73890 [Calothrix brevissima NIES-22]